MLSQERITWNPRLLMITVGMHVAGGKEKKKKKGVVLKRITNIQHQVIA